MARFRHGLARDVPSEIAGASLSKLKPGLSRAWMRRGHVILPDRLLPCRRLAFLATQRSLGRATARTHQFRSWLKPVAFRVKAISNLSCRPGRQVE
jgi:hypothetical protein